MAGQGVCAATQRSKGRDLQWLAVTRRWHGGGTVAARRWHACAGSAVKPIRVRTHGWLSFARMRVSNLASRNLRRYTCQS